MVPVRIEQESATRRIFEAVRQGADWHLVAINNGAKVSTRANIHIIGAISQNGLYYWERRKGSYKKEEAADFVKRLIRVLVGDGINKQNLVIVCVNALSHSNIEVIFLEQEFNFVRILRLGPYSPQLNPIKSVWSFVIEKCKSLHAIRDE